MTKEERQALILELLMQHDSILVTDLATHLNVSSVTIRKDLTDLEREKKLYRNHGKAILIDPYIDNRNVSEKEKLYVEEKRLIERRADRRKARLIHSAAILRRPFRVFAVAAVPCGGNIRKGSFHIEYLRYFIM